MAGDAVIDELDVAVVAAPDEYAALAADVCLAQDASVVCSFFGAMPSPCTLVISSTRKVISCVSASPSVFSR